MRQGQQRRDTDISPRYAGPPLPGGVGPGSTSGDDVRAHAVDIEACTHLGNLAQHGVRQSHIADRPLGRGDPGRQLILFLLVLAPESGGVGVECHPAANDLHAHIRVTRGADLHSQAETVQ